MFMKIKEKSFGTSFGARTNRKAAVYLAVVLASMTVLGMLVAGWVMNIVKIFNAEALDGVVVARVIGAFIAPLGGVMGWF